MTGLVPVLVVFGCVIGEGSLAGAPVKVIFDSDMDSDCDDAGAMAVLHALADKGEVEILATVTCGRNAWAPLTISALNTYYGRTNIPVGAPKFNAPLRESKYTRLVADKFPHALRQSEDAEDAVELYCRVLDQAEDNSVVILTVGYLSNLSALLKQSAKGNRPSGMELVRRKVRQWACMGGNFLGTPARDDLKLGNTNFVVDKEATYYVIKHWPARVMFVGREIGSVPSGLKAGARLVETPENNPVRFAYELYFGGKAKDRHVADPTTVLYAVRGLGDYWDAHTTGSMDLQPDMTFEWKEGAACNQGYLLKKRVNGKPNDQYIEQTIEGLMIQPPRKSP